MGEVLVGERSSLSAFVTEARIQIRHNIDPGQSATVTFAGKIRRPLAGSSPFVEYNQSPVVLAGGLR